jgi:hypothetical protein
VEEGARGFGPALTHRRYRPQTRRFSPAGFCVPRKGSEMGPDVPEAAYVGLPLLGEFERRRDMADEYAGCH